MNRLKSIHDRIKENRRSTQWKEIEEYRDLLQAPDQFEEGFTIKTVIGVLFISLIMTPGEMYLGLFNGTGIGGAPQWVTVILFLEVAKRSFSTLRRQEIYLLVYVAGALVAREEGAFLDLLWRQYFVRSPEAAQFGLTKVLPWWWAPPADSPALAERTFLHSDWAMPIFLLVMGTIMGRIAWFTSGYLLFRLTSDREQLPFPTAPMAALSSMALAEESGAERETWKLSVFSIGAIIGAVFGAIYTGVPTVTDVMFGQMVKLIPIPFWDLTPYFGSILPATPVAISINLGGIFAGLYAPFWGIVGSFAGTLIAIIVSPILYINGFFPRWQLGMDVINTGIVTSLDFWSAFSMGITLAMTIISLIMLWQTGSKDRAETRERLKGARVEYPPFCRHEGCDKPSEVRGYCLKHLARGDFNIWACVALFCVAAVYPIILAKALFPQLVGTGLLVIFVLIGFVYAPIISFVSARLDGLIGREFSLPYINEAIIYLTGFRGVEIWFVPFPARNFGGHAEGFRVVELTGMKFTSLLKAEFFMLPIVFGVSMMYWSFLWKLAPIPSESYPYAQLMWPRRAFFQAMGYAATTYNMTWRAGEKVTDFAGRSLDEEPVNHGEVVWSPSNLQDRNWWFWRVKATSGGQVYVPDPIRREYGPWSRSGYFYTDFAKKGPPASGVDEILRRAAVRPDTGAVDPDLPPAPRLLWPPDGAVVHTPNPNMRATVEVASGDTVEFYFEVDMLSSFDGEFLQRSSDIPMFWKSILWDVEFTGDRRDDDGDRWIEALVREVQEREGDFGNLVLGARAGLQVGDRLHALNGQVVQVRDWDRAAEAIAAQVQSVQDSLYIEFERAGKVLQRRVELRPREPLGMDLEVETPWLFGTSTVTIAEIEPFGLGARAELKMGDRLHALNGETVRVGEDSLRTAELIQEQIRSAGDSLFIEFERDGEILPRRVAYARQEGLGVLFEAGAVQGVDEELINGRDDDGDGRVDEDNRMPWPIDVQPGTDSYEREGGGHKWRIIAGGAIIGVFFYILLSFFGLPLFLVFGYIQSVNDVGFGWIFSMTGALLARFYFWKRYGMQQWRQYAMVLAVGYGVGMALIGMFCAALAMISKAISPLSY